MPATCCCCGACLVSGEGVLLWPAGALDHVRGRDMWESCGVLSGASVAEKLYSCSCVLFVWEGGPIAGSPSRTTMI